MIKTFKGRAVIPGKIKGDALVTHTGFNTLASFYNVILSNASRAVCGDQDNPELFGQEITGKILCLPKGAGSTSAGAAWLKIAKMGLAPRAMLFSQHIDSLSAAGMALAEVWASERICTIDQLGSEFLDYVRTGQTISVEPDGTVICEIP